MAYPIVTLLFALGVAFLTFQTSTIDSGIDEEVPELAPADDAAEPEMDAGSPAEEMPAE